MSVSDVLDLEWMAAALFRIVEDKPWREATAQQRRNYLAICQQTVDAVKSEQSQQQSEDGRKEVA